MAERRTTPWIYVSTACGVRVGERAYSGIASSKKVLCYVCGEDLVIHQVGMFLLSFHEAI